MPKPSSYQEIFRTGLAALNEAKDFLERKESMRNSLRALYLAAPSDDAFFPLAQTFLSTAHYQKHSEALDYVVTLHDRSTKIVVRPVIGDSKKCFSFEYDEALLRERESWHDYFMGMARRASERTTCASGRKVGAVFVLDKVPLMSGFNGVPKGFPHPKKCPRIEAGCKSGEGLDMCPCNHAERNAINLASRHGVQLDGATLYCTTKPCFGCMGDLSVAGVSRVIFEDDYPHEVSNRIAFYGNIQVLRISEAKNEVA